VTISHSKKFNAMSLEQTLKNQQILVTRPQPQAANFARLIEQHGGCPVIFPTLEICPVENSQTIKQTLENLKTYQWLIFVSVNAVNFAVTANNGKIDKFKHTKIAAVGKATAKALENLGLTVDLVPDSGFNSEALLETPALKNVQNQKVLIVRGVGGRETLADTLKQRGASVDYVEVYQRQLPEADPTPVVNLLKTQQLDWVTITSTEALQNLVIMLKPYHTLLMNIPLLVISERIKQIAQTLGFSRVVVSGGPDETAILNTIIMLINGEDRDRRSN
jgi:uroporphyrinogen-III synthase